MNEEFDDRLKSRLTEVFDNFEDDSAHEGWLLLREKYPEGKRRPILWLWLAPVAAMLLVFLGIGIWLDNRTSHIDKPKTMVNNTIIKKHMDTLGAANHAVIDNPDQGQVVAQTNPTVNPNKVDAQVQNRVAVQINPNNKATKHTLSSSSVTKTFAANPLNRFSINKGYNKTQSQQNNNPTIIQSDKNTEQIADNKKQAESQQEKTSQPAANEVAPATSNSLVNSNPIAKVTPDATKPEVEQAHKTLLTAKAGEPKNIKEPVSNKVKFGVYAATYFNYAKGSDNEFNVGAGISSEIKLVGNLKLITGVAITQNSLSYNLKNDIPQTANNYLASAISAQNRNFLAAAAPAGTTFYSPQSSTVTTPVLKNYQASLIGLDIPVNLKYQFSKSDNYISAGLSSGTYINETYQYVYNYSGTTVATQDNNSKSQSNFSTFDVAKTLNVSFGMGYPLGKTNRLIIEPFLKYPLNGLGAQQLRFGAGGVNLKLNISGKK